MVDVYKNLPSFITGEISPKLSGRIDSDKYHMALETLSNYIVQPQGCVTRRAGTRYVQETKDSAKYSRLIEFVFSITDTRILEFGNNYIRFYQDVNGVGVPILSGGTPIEVTTPYADTNIWDLKFEQPPGDVMFITHPNFAPRKLSRISDTDWHLDYINFIPPPSYIANTYLSANCVLSAITGLNITFTASSPVFRKADVDRALVMGASRAIITSWVSDSVVHCDIVDDWPGADDTGWTFGTLTIAQNYWYLTGSPVAGIMAETNAPVDKIIQVLATDNDGAAINVTISGSTVTVPYPSHGLNNGDYVSVNVIDKLSACGVFVVTVNDANTFHYTARSAPGDGSYFSFVYLPLSAFRSDDLNKYIKMDDGIVQITSVVNSARVKAKILSSLKDIGTHVFAGAWSLNVRSWNKIDGGGDGTYPVAIGLYQNRLILGGTDKQPATVWGSATEEYENFAVGIKDDDAIEYTLTTQNKIKWVACARSIIVGTQNEEILLGVPQNGALTPTNVRAIIQSSLGVSGIAPLIINNIIIFPQRDGNKLWEFSYNFYEDSYKGIDLTYLAEHITLPFKDGILDWSMSGIRDMVYQRAPISTIWCVLNSGKLLSLTYLRSDNWSRYAPVVTENIAGWAQHSTGVIESDDPHITGVPNGWFESACVQAITGRDRIWVIVKRLINGVYKRYVEYIDDNAWLGAHGWQWGELFSDCAKVYTGLSSTTITGLDHLAGKKVTVLGDGQLQTPKIVPSITPFNIVIDTLAVNVEIGLPYVSLGLTVAPEVPTPNGSAQCRVKGWSEIVAKLHKTIGGYVNEEPIKFYMVNNKAKLFTGEHEVRNIGWDRAGRICFSQRDPLPMTVLSFTGKLSIA